MSWPPCANFTLRGPDPAVGAFSFPTRQAKRSRSAARPQKQKRPTRLPVAPHGAGERGMIMPIAATAYQRQIPHARQAARQELVRSVQEGMTAREARRCCPVQIHRTTVYRLLKRVEREGEQALAERRHGHRIKLRGEVLTFLLDYCQSHPAISSAEVQHLLAERFALSVSVSQLNRVRAAHGLSRQPVPSIRREKKAANWRHYCPRIS